MASFSYPNFVYKRNKSATSLGAEKARKALRCHVDEFGDIRLANLFMKMIFNVVDGIGQPVDSLNGFIYAVVTADKALLFALR